VTVDGAQRTRPAAIVTALRLEPGEPVDLAQWAQARKRLYDTNIFRQVDVRPEPLADPRPDGAEAVRARVTVTEWPVWRLRYGVQFNDTNLATQGSDTSVDRSRGLGVVADLQNRNVFGWAFTFGLYGRAERRLQSGSAYLTFPTLFGRAVQTNVFGSGSHLERFLDEKGDPTVRQVRTSISLEQRVRRGRAMELVYGYRVIRDEQAAIDPEDPFFLAPVTGRFTGSALFDRRNDFFDPTGGWFGSFTVERVSEFVSNDDSIKLLGTFYRYQPIGRVTLASAIRIGGSLLGTLRFVDPFFVGGADTVRGYGEDALGPKNILGAQGGDSLLVLNQEVRAPIYKWLRGVAFIDAGNVFARNRPSWSGLEVGYGVGIRLHTPFSILRVDMGVPARSGSRRWYFGIGQIF
jgi:outer membrane translocation and assembly module TamA